MRTKINHSLPRTSRSWLNDPWLVVIRDFRVSGLCSLKIRVLRGVYLEELIFRGLIVVRERGSKKFRWSLLAIKSQYWQPGVFYNNVHCHLLYCLWFCIYNTLLSKNRKLFRNCRIPCNGLNAVIALKRYILCRVQRSIVGLLRKRIDCCLLLPSMSLSVFDHHRSVPRVPRVINYWSLPLMTDYPLLRGLLLHSLSVFALIRYCPSWWYNRKTMLQEVNHECRIKLFRKEII